MLPAKQITMLIPELTYAELVVVRDVMMTRMINIQKQIHQDLREPE